MSTALRFVVPVSPLARRLRALALRFDAVPTLYVGGAALTVLLGGLLLAIVTTSDPLWWQLHFSELGIFGDLSSAFFNTTLKVSGGIVVLFAFRVRRDVRRVGRGSVGRGAATIPLICLNVVGVNLALVGCIPLNTDKDFHDRVAGSMVLGFLALLLTAPFLFHRLGKRLVVCTGVAIAWLAIAIALFVSATINLALFETVSCAAMFAWSGVFTHVLASAASTATTERPSPSAHMPQRRASRLLASGRRVRPDLTRRPSGRDAARSTRSRHGAGHPGNAMWGAPARLGGRSTHAGLDARLHIVTSTHRAGHHLGGRPTAPTGPGRRLTASGASTLSASRAVLAGSTGEVRSTPARRSAPLSRPVAPAVARWLLR